MKEVLKLCAINILFNYYNGKEINVIERLPKIIKKIKSIKYVVIINYPGKNYLKIKSYKNIKILKWREITKKQLVV